MAEQNEDEKLIHEITGGQFAKVFNLDESQVLVQWDFNPEDDTYLLQFDFRLHGTRGCVKLDGFKDLEKCLNAFDQLEKQNVADFYNSILEKSAGDPMNLIMQ